MALVSILNIAFTYTNTCKILKRILNKLSKRDILILYYIYQVKYFVIYSSLTITMILL